MNHLLFIILSCICALLPGVEMRTHYAGSSSELQSALNIASPGDTISLLPQEYKGDFTTSRSGTYANPIRLVGTSQQPNSNSKIVPNRVGLHIVNDYWVVENISVKGGDIGIKVDGNDVNLLQISMSGVKKGIVLEKGKGNKVIGTSYSSGGTSLVVSERSCCGKVDENSFAGAVDFKGKKYEINKNSASGKFKLTGCENILKGNRFDNGDLNKSCNNVDGSNSISTCGGWNVFLYRCWG